MYTHIFQPLTTPNKPRTSQQGVNSALLDVLALDEVLDNAHSTPSTPSMAPAAAPAAAAAPDQQQHQKLESPEALDLKAAASEYQKRQLPQAVALCNLLPVGFPFQYFASARRNLWTAVFLAQMAVNKLLPWLMPPATFMMVQDSK